MASTIAAAAAAPLKSMSTRSSSTTCAASSPRPLPGGVDRNSSIVSRISTDLRVDIASNRVRTSNAEPIAATQPAIVTWLGRGPVFGSLMATLHHAAQAACGGRHPVTPDTWRCCRGAHPHHAAGGMA